MTRLTNDSRDKITEMVIDHKFTALRAELARENANLAMLCYEDDYTSALRLAMVKVMAFDKGAFGMSNVFRVNAGGWQVEMKLAGPAPFLEKHSGVTRYKLPATIFNYTADSNLGTLVREHAEKARTLEKEIKHLTDQVRGQLNAHYTFDKASKAWPEIDVFIRAVERGLPQPQLTPALADHSALNQALDLPPK